MCGRVRQQKDGGDRADWTYRWFARDLSTNQFIATPPLCVASDTVCDTANGGMNSVAVHADAGSSAAVTAGLTGQPPPCASWSEGYGRDRR